MRSVKVYLLVKTRGVRVPPGKVKGCFCRPTAVCGGRKEGHFTLQAPAFDVIDQSRARRFASETWRRSRHSGRVPFHRRRNVSLPDVITLIWAKKSLGFCGRKAQTHADKAPMLWIISTILPIRGQCRRRPDKGPRKEARMVMVSESSRILQRPLWRHLL